MVAEVGKKLINKNIDPSIVHMVTGYSIYWNCDNLFKTMASALPNRRIM